MWLRNYELTFYVAHVVCVVKTFLSQRGYVGTGFSNFLGIFGRENLWFYLNNFPNENLLVISAINVRNHGVLLQTIAILYRGRLRTMVDKRHCVRGQCHRMTENFQQEMDHGKQWPVAITKSLWPCRPTQYGLNSINFWYIFISHFSS